MAYMNEENRKLLEGSEVFVPMSQDVGFVVAIPVGATVSLSKDQGALSVHTDDPDGPQATMRASTKAEIEKNPEQAAHMQTVNGLDNVDSEMTIHRHEDGMTAFSSGDARLTQGVTSITPEQMDRVLTQASPTQKPLLGPS